MIADKYVTIDASAIIAVLVSEESRDDLVRAVVGKSLVAPLSIPWEVSNAFSAMFKQKRLNLENAISAIKKFHMLPVRYVEVDHTAVLKLAHKWNLYSYDAALLCCALEQGTGLLSLDQKLNVIAEKMQLMTFRKGDYGYF